MRLRSNRHGAAAWLTGTRAEPMTIADERAAGTVFAATVNATAASPCPDVVASATQFDSADADHVQSRVVEIVIEPLPPIGGNVAVGASPTVTWHLSTLGAVTEDEAEPQDNARSDASTTSARDRHGNA